MKDHDRFYVALYNIFNGIVVAECEETLGQASDHPRSITDKDKIEEMANLEKQIDRGHQGTECYFFLKIDDSELLRSRTPLMKNDSDSEVEKKFKNGAWLGVRNKLNTNKRDQSEKRTARILLNAMAMVEPFTLSESGAAHEQDIDLIPMLKKKRYRKTACSCKACNEQQTTAYALIRDKYPNRTYQPRPEVFSQVQNFQQFASLIERQKSLQARLSQLGDKLAN